MFIIFDFQQILFLTNFDQTHGYGDCIEAFIIIIVIIWWHFLCKSVLKKIDFGTFKLGIGNLCLGFGVRRGHTRFRPPSLPNSAKNLDFKREAALPDSADRQKRTYTDRRTNIKLHAPLPSPPRPPLPLSRPTICTDGYQVMGKNFLVWYQVGVPGALCAISEQPRTSSRRPGKPTLCTKGQPIRIDLNCTAS